MKKLLFITLLACSTFALPSCGGEGEKKSQDPEPSIPAAAHPIEGKWFVTRKESQSFDAANNPQPPKIENLYPYFEATFTAPNLFREDHGNQYFVTANYFLTDNHVELTVNPVGAGFRPGIYRIDSLTTTRLVMQQEIPVNPGQTPRQIFIYRLKR